LPGFESADALFELAEAAIADETIGDVDENFEVVFDALKAVLRRPFLGYPVSRYDPNG
jgi:hypothetical protein